MAIDIIAIATNGMLVSPGTGATQDITVEIDVINTEGDEEVND